MKFDKKTIINFVLLFIMTSILILCLVDVWNSMYLSIAIILIVIIAALLITAIIAKLTSYDSIFKLTVITIYIGVVMMILYYILITSGFLERFENVSELKAFINSTNGKSELIFVIAQFLQVTFIPIPSSPVVLVGYMLFGSVKAYFLSMIGLLLGSMLAFFLGKAFGQKLVIWIAGEEAFIKYQKLVKGRDKMILILMFMFPMFPDDILCMVAGLTSMSYPTFFVVMLFSRTFAVGGTILFQQGLTSIIPFSGWGIPIWVLIIIGLVVLFLYTFKNGDKIEMFMLKTMGKLTGRDLISQLYPVQKGEVPIDKNITDNTRVVIYDEDKLKNVKSHKIKIRKSKQFDKEEDNTSI